MGADNLKVEEHKNDLKNAAGEKQEGYVKPVDVKSVDDFIKTLKDEAKKAEDTNNTNYQAEIKKAKEEKKNETEINKIKEKYGKTEKTENIASTEIQKATMKMFIENSPGIVNTITINLFTNFDKIGRVRGYADINTLIEAKNAFQEDISRFKVLPGYIDPENKLEKSIKDLETQINIKMIDLDPSKVNNFNKKELKDYNDKIETSKIKIDDNSKKAITDRILALEKNEKDNIVAIFNTNRTPELARDFLESDKNEGAFNAAFDYIAKIQTENIDSYKAKNPEEQVKETQINYFIKLLKQAYIQDGTVTDISLVVAGPNDENNYPENTKYISLKDADGKDKYIIFGTMDKWQGKKAETLKIETTDLAMNDPLAQFDGCGNYKALERYMKEKPEEFQKNFKNVITAIIDYQNNDVKDENDKVIKDITETTDSDEDLIQLKNGYANVLTDFIIANSATNPLLLNTYMLYLTKGNANILGGDETVRMMNLDKLKKTPKFIEEFNKLPNEQRILIGEFVSNEISKEKKMSIKEAIIKLMTFFGFGKGQLKQRFPGMKEQIDKAFNDHFRLDPPEKKTAVEATIKGSELKQESLGRLKPGVGDKDATYTPPEGAEIQKVFEENKTVVNTIMEKEDYYKWIDPMIVKKGIQAYNADKNNPSNFKESDFIIGNELKVASLKSKTNQDKLKEILMAVMRDKNTRDSIATANKRIQGISKGKDNTQYSPYLDNSDEIIGYRINTQKDIGRYLVSYLFAGSKDLANTMTENKFINDHIDTPVQKPKEYVVGSETKIRDDNGQEITNSTLKTNDIVTEILGVEEKSAQELKIQQKDIPTGETLDGYKFQKIRATINGTKVEGWIPVKARTEKTANTPAQNPKVDQKTPEAQKEKLSIPGDYATELSGVYTLTEAVKAKRIDQIFTSDKPQSLLITPKGGTASKKIERGKADIKGTQVDTYVYTDKKTQRVIINAGDKLEAAEKTADTINKQRTTISTALENTGTNKMNFKELNIDKTYEKEIDNLSGLFTTGTKYTELTGDKDNKNTLKDMITTKNIPHLKNMLTYRSLKQKENKDIAIYGPDKMTLDQNLVSNIDTTKQNYEILSATAENGIVIVAKESGTEKGSIIVKNNNGKITTERKKTPAKTA